MAIRPGSNRVSLPEGVYEVRQFVQSKDGKMSEIMEQRDTETGTSLFSSTIELHDPRSGAVATVQFPVIAGSLEGAFVALSPTRAVLIEELQREARSQIVKPARRITRRRRGGPGPNIIKP